jgi:hypothetical protein
VQDQPGRAARLFGVVEAQLDILAAPLISTDRIEYQRHLAAARAQLAEAAFAAALAEGRAMSLDQALAYALADSDLAA